MKQIVDFKELEVWFITGSQYLYGEKALQQVEEHAREMVVGLDNSPVIPVRVVYKPVVKTPEEILKVCQEANQARNCIGLIA